jgi:hypothetical protein
MFHVYVKTLALQEKLDVGVPLQRRVGGHLVQHFLQGGAPGLDKPRIKTANGLLLGWGWDYDAGVISVERVVEPQEVAIAAFNFKLGSFVGLGRSLNEKC